MRGFIKSLLQLLSNCNLLYSHEWRAAVECVHTLVGVQLSTCSHTQLSTLAKAAEEQQAAANDW
jgi:hypothetical protein